MFFIVTVTNRIPVFFFRKTKQIQVRRTVTGTKTPGGKSHSNRIHSKKIKQRQSRGNFIRRLHHQKHWKVCSKIFHFVSRFHGVKRWYSRWHCGGNSLKSAPHVFSFNCYLHFSSMWNQQSIFSLTSHHLCNCNGDFICIAPKMSNLCHSFIS